MIELNNKWALSAEGLNIHLLRKATPKKEKGGFWSVVGYFATLHGALRELVNQEIRDTDLASLKELTAKIDEVYKLIDGLPEIIIENLRG